MQQRCPNCGAPVVPGQRFCGGCGAQLSLSCPQCRITVSPGTRYCPNCGATLGGGPTQQPGWGAPGGAPPPQQPGWGQPGVPPQQQGWGQQPGWGQQQQPYAPPAPKSQSSSSSSRPFLVLLLFILLIGMGALAYLKTPLGDTVNSILGFSGSTTNGSSTVVDTTAPDITFPDQPTVSATSAGILWETDEPSSTQVEYGTSNTYGTREPAQPGDDPASGTSLGVVTHSVVLTGLQPNTTYHYRVRSIDAAGNEAVSSDKTFTTSEASSS
jgi:hypothetical protein